MEKIVVDTDIIIDYLAGVEEAAMLLDSIRAECRFTTSVNCMEALQGARSHIELKKLDKFLLGAFQILGITARSSSLALELIRSHALRDGLRTGDALIAAVTIENGAKLVTGNHRHFKGIPELEVNSYKKK
jgi:predicted nucleic acid-binding protein